MLSEKAQRPVSSLVSRLMMAPVEHSLALVSWNDECQDLVLRSWSCSLNVQQILLHHIVSSGDGSRLDDQHLRRVPSDILKGSDGSL